LGRGRLGLASKSDARAAWSVLGGWHLGSRWRASLSHDRRLGLGLYLGTTSKLDAAFARSRHGGLRFGRRNRLVVLRGQIDGIQSQHGHLGHRRARRVGA
jgi:hypothetical protein